MTELRLAYFGSSTAVDGGSELCLLRMARYFADRYSVTLFLPDDGPLFRSAVSAGIDTINLDFLRLRRHRGLDWFRWWHGVRGARQRLKEACVERRIDLIHFNDFIDLPFYTVAHELGLPSVAHLRLILSKRLARSVYRSKVRSAGSFVVPVSHSVAKQMLGDQPRIPFQVIYDPAPNPTHFFPKEVSQHRDSFQIVMVSKLLENKGHLNFCRVAQELERASPGKFVFNMVAPPSPGREQYSEEVQREFSKLPKDRSQFIPGAEHSELGELLRSSDLLLHLPDTEDSFPGVVMEAMACGTPVLAYPVGGIPEQLENGAVGILVERGDIKAIAESVTRVAEDAGLWKRIANDSIKKVSTDFSAETHFRTLEEVYRNLLGT